MSISDLRSLIISLATDIEFRYKGVHGAICPYAEDDIGFVFDGVNIDYTSVDDLLADPVIMGKSLNEVSTEIELM